MHMKKFVALALLLFAVPVMADDIARHQDITIEGVSSPGQNMMQNGTVLVISVTKDTFGDGGPAYVEALGMAGMVADLYYDPELYGWPDISPYKLIIVVFNDNWWSGYWTAADEAVLADFTGGLVLVGQDYPYAVGQSAWFLARFGIAGIVEDINYGDASPMDIVGIAGGPFDGKMMTLMSTCWEANDWFTDDVSYLEYGAQDWSGGGYAGGGGAVVADGIFSTNAYECGPLDADNFWYWVADMIAWLKGGTPTEDTSWSQLKDLYR
jgi:hypothetical protein